LPPFCSKGQQFLGVAESRASGLRTGRRFESCNSPPELWRRSSYAAAARAASPLSYVTGDDPPFLILHGTEDCLVSPHQSQRLHDALQSAGVDVTLSLVAGGKHGGILDAPGSLMALETFLDRVLCD
jgi:acetyl esterase/lipase